MPFPALTEETLRATAEAVRVHGSVSGAARALGVNRSTLEHRYREARTRGIATGRELNAEKVRGGRPAGPNPSSGSRPTPGVSVEFAVNTGLVTYTDERVLSVEDALRKGNVDTELWEVDRHTLNSWEVGAKDGTNEGQMLVTPLWQVKVWLRRRRPLDGGHVAAIVLEEVRDQARRQHARTPGKAAKATSNPKTRTRPASGERFCVEISVPDLHIGKLAWKPETGEHYDAKIALGVYGHCVEQLLERVGHLPVERFWLPVGNDLLHVDTEANTTTAGTRQDVDGRWKRSFRLAWRMLVAQIERLAVIAPVEVPVVPGNHDRMSGWMLGELLDARFEGHTRVRVDNGPAPRKYLAYGPSLVMWAHGDGVREQEIEGLMARERSAEFAASRHREAHMGHWHKRKRRDWIGADTWGSVVARVLPSLSGTDHWHAQMGYVNGPRAAEAYLWSSREGYAGHFSVSPPEGAYR